MAFIDAHRHRFGVEPICAVLVEHGVGIAPCAYYAARRRPPSARAQRDAWLREEIARVHKENYDAYGAAKVWDHLNRVEHITVARCTVERLMRQLGLEGTRRGATVRTTTSDPDADRPADLVNRDFTVPAPNRLWLVLCPQTFVGFESGKSPEFKGFDTCMSAQTFADTALADLTYVRTLSGWVYVSFVIDAYSRRVLGWQASRSLRTELALDALEMAISGRRRDGHGTAEVTHHSDRGSQYLSIRYSQRLDDNDIVASVVSKGDSYDNAMIESFNGLFKWELIYPRGPWQALRDVEFANLEYVDWYNHRRSHSALLTGSGNYTTPAEHETAYYRQTVTATPAVTQQPKSLLNSEDVCGEWAGCPGAVGVVFDGEVVGVELVVVFVAEQGEVGQVGRAAVHPMPDVV